MAFEAVKTDYINKELDESTHSSWMILSSMQVMSHGRHSSKSYSDALFALALESRSWIFSRQMYA